LPFGDLPSLRFRAMNSLGGLFALAHLLDFLPEFSKSFDQQLLKHFDFFPLVFQLLVLRCQLLLHLRHLTFE
jgi:hypothetical protein